MNWTSWGRTLPLGAIVASVAIAVCVLRRRRRQTPSSRLTGPSKKEKSSHEKNSVRHERECAATLHSHFAAFVGESHATRLLAALRTPPAMTTLRVNTAVVSRDQCLEALQAHLAPQVVQAHPSLPDVLVIAGSGPHEQPLLARVIAVNRACAEAVLRGSDVYAPGIVGCSAELAAGDRASVVAVDPQCLPCLSTGCKLSPSAVLTGQGWIHLGNGVVEISRQRLFPPRRHDLPEGAAPKVAGLAVRMTDRRHEAPSLNGVLPEWTFLQNLPSMLVAHVLAPRPTDLCLDLCAAPGGKTTHVAALMAAAAAAPAAAAPAAAAPAAAAPTAAAAPATTPTAVSAAARGFRGGMVLGCDRSKSRLAQVGKLAERLGLGSRVALAALDATHAAEKLAAGGYPTQWDRIVLDPPCSSLGQRPRLSWATVTTSELEGCAEYQRRLMSAAVGLLKPGGVLVYSTCTLSPDENEGLIAYALREHPELSLEPPEDPALVLGDPGWRGCGLSAAECELVQRFDPSSARGEGSIGFFLARLRKAQAAA